MDWPLRIVIPGVPVPWARVGANTAHGVQFYTKPKSREYTDRIRGKAMVKMQGRGAILTGPVSMRIMVNKPIPKSWPKWKRKAALLNQFLPIKKPDLDNYEKSPLDALSKIVYVDDAQVTDKITTKRYAAEPSLIVIVAPIEPVAA